MKTFKDVLKFISIEIVLGIAAAMLFFWSCSSSNVQDVVCDYGAVVCDVSTTLCYDIPGVPAEVCTYLDLACYNLNQLCLMRDSTESEKYKISLVNLRVITDKLRAWKQQRQSTQNNN